MIIIGITGSIGTGKSTIASMMRILRLPVHDSDLEVKKILENNELAKKKIEQKWPGVTFSLGNKQIINKTKLAEIIFNHPKDRSFLENILVIFAIPPIFNIQVGSSISFCLINN